MLPGLQAQAHDAIERKSKKADHRVRTYALGESVVYRCDFDVESQHTEPPLDIGQRLASTDRFDWVRSQTLVNSTSLPSNSSASEIAS